MSHLDFLFGKWADGTINDQEHWLLRKMSVLYFPYFIRYVIDELNQKEGKKEFTLVDTNVKTSIGYFHAYSLYLKEQLETLRRVLANMSYDPIKETTIPSFATDSLSLKRFHVEEKISLGLAVLANRQFSYQPIFREFFVPDEMESTFLYPEEISVFDSDCGDTCFALQRINLEELRDMTTYQRAISYLSLCQYFYDQATMEKEEYGKDTSSLLLSKKVFQEKR